MTNRAAFNSSVCVAVESSILSCQSMSSDRGDLVRTVLFTGASAGDLIQSVLPIILFSNIINQIPILTNTQAP